VVQQLFFVLICCTGVTCFISVPVKMPLEWLFGKRMTPEEMLRRNQRALNKAMRDLDRERARMEQQEKKIITDIKKMAKEGQMVCRHIYYMKLFTES
jgi:hypothetical protein